MMAKNKDKRGTGTHFLRKLLLLALLLMIAWGLWVNHKIQQVAHDDQARPADAIAVFGAAQYLGRPSPVYHARLAHAVTLYQLQLAPVIITLGGSSDRKTTDTEGAAGRDYLLANGVPYDHVIAETTSLDTEEQAHVLAQIARAHGLKTIIAVSDPTHLFRIRELCRREGLDVLTSPRPQYGHISGEDSFDRTMHEILSYTALRLGLEVGWLHRWLGREDPL